MGKNKAYYWTLVILSVLLLWKNTVFSEPMRITENLRNEEVFLPASAPDRSHLVLQGFTMVLTKDGITHLAIYDDPQTDRAADYLELYDFEGNLLLAEWVDKFGIIRMAVDRGLLEQDGAGIQRILFLLVEGNPV